MIQTQALRCSVESYITSHAWKGHYLLASDGGGRWYWAPAYAAELDQTWVTDLRGPYSSRGDALIAGEDWVETQGGGRVHQG